MKVLKIIYLIYSQYNSDNNIVQMNLELKTNNKKRKSLKTNIIKKQSI